MNPKTSCFCVVLFCLLLLPAPCHAAENGTKNIKTVADTPSPASPRSVKVAVEHEGADMVGARLALALKGVFNAHSLFALTETDAPKMKVYLATAPEFPGRPALASVYAVVWAFSQNNGTLSFLLGREVGVAAADEVDALAVKIAEQTYGFAVKYSYLFKE